MFSRLWCIIAFLAIVNFYSSYLLSNDDVVASPYVLTNLQSSTDTVLSEPWCVLKDCILGGTVRCVNVHKLEIIDSEIHGDITFQGMSGVVEFSGETVLTGSVVNGEILSVGCVNMHLLNISNSVIYGNITFEGICRALECNSH